MKNTKLILIAVVALGLILLVVDYRAAKVGFDGRLDRSSPGGRTSAQTLELSFLENEEEIEIEVSPKGLSEKEIQQALKDAVTEIDETYLGDNESANEVCHNLLLKDSYADGLVEVKWTFDKYGYISDSGEINKEKIPKEGQLITISANMICESSEQIYSFCVVVVPVGLDTKEGQLDAITNAVKEKDETSREEDTLVLPTKVQDMEITWKKKMDYRGLQLIILGFITVAGISIGKKRDAKKLKDEFIEEMDIDYPMIVSELSILMGAGMSFRKALERMVVKYKNNLKNEKFEKRPGFEQMLFTYRRMTDGLSEIQAIEELGAKCESKNYRKLSMLLSQNLRKGSKDLIDCLEKEQQNAFELRKQRAIRAGEEASTKLLIPMAGMLFIVIVILVIPAMLQINI